MTEPMRSATPSASERWLRHFITDWCPVCQIDPEHPERDRLCRIGGELRAAAIAESRKETKVA